MEKKAGLRWNKLQIFWRGVLAERWTSKHQKQPKPEGYLS